VLLFEAYCLTLARPLQLYVQTESQLAIIAQSLIMIIRGAVACPAAGAIAASDYLC
jgi:hypothetical protein